MQADHHTGETGSTRWLFRLSPRSSPLSESLSEGSSNGGGGALMDSLALIRFANCPAFNTFFDPLPSWGWKAETGPSQGKKGPNPYSTVALKTGSRVLIRPWKLGPESWLCCERQPAWESKATMCTAVRQQKLSDSPFPFCFKFCKLFVTSRVRILNIYYHSY